VAWVKIKYNKPPTAMSARQWILRFTRYEIDSAIIVSAETALHARNRMKAGLRKPSKLLDLSGTDNGTDRADEEGPFQAKQSEDKGDSFVLVDYDTMHEMVKGAWIEEVKVPLIVDLC